MCNKPPEHDANDGETDEGGVGSGVTLEVARQAPEAVDPGEGAFDDPALGQDLEPNGRGWACDDHDRPPAGLGRSRGGLRPLIAAVAIDEFDEGEQATRAPVEHQRNTIAILHGGAMDGHAQQHAQRSYDNGALATRARLDRV